MDRQTDGQTDISTFTKSCFFAAKKDKNLMFRTLSTSYKSLGLEFKFPMLQKCKSLYLAAFS